MTKTRVYHHPVPYDCNADCVFCVSKSQTPLKFRGKSYPFPGREERFRNAVMANRFDEIEITGGGEPFLDPDRLSEVISLIREIRPKAKIKLYTNGFAPALIPFVDELNVSRVHPDPEANARVMRPKNGIGPALPEIIDFFRLLCGTLRLQVPLLAGYVDTRDKVLALTRDPGLSRVDTFMVRELFADCPRAAALRVVLDGKFAGIPIPKVKWDFQERDCVGHPFICADGYWHPSWRHAWEKAKTPPGQEGVPFVAA